MGTESISIHSHNAGGRHPKSALGPPGHSLAGTSRPIDPSLNHPGALEAQEPQPSPGTPAQPGEEAPLPGQA